MRFPKTRQTRLFQRKLRLGSWQDSKRCWLGRILSQTDVKKKQIPKRYSREDCKKLKSNNLCLVSEVKTSGTKSMTKANSARSGKSSRANLETLRKHIHDPLVKKTARRKPSSAPNLKLLCFSPLMKHQGTASNDSNHLKTSLIFNSSNNCSLIIKKLKII